MIARRRRMVLVISGLLIFASGVGLLLYAVRDQLVFFYSPSELMAAAPSEDRLVRIGGLVGAGSVRHQPDDGRFLFTVTDGETSVEVGYHGLPPDLFAEGEGVVVQGYYREGEPFEATEVLAKHDETYMPPEVVDSLKQSGRWNADGAGLAP